MNKMLSDALREYHGLREQLDRALLGDNADEWGKKLRALMRGEPVNAEGMIYIPLEISDDLGVCHQQYLERRINTYNRDKSPGWRLPTYKEMHRILEKGKLQDWEYYYTSEHEGIRNRLTVLRRHNAGFGSSDSVNETAHLCLVREVKLLE